MTVDTNVLNTLAIPLKYSEKGPSEEPTEDNESENELDDSLGNLFENAPKENDEALDEIRSDLSTLANSVSFGKYLQIKDFSSDFSDKKPTDGTKDKQFLQVIVNGKKYVIKKSSLCWLLDEKNSRISTDRLKRFVQNKARPEAKPTLSRSSSSRIASERVTRSNKKMVHGKTSEREVRGKVKRKVSPNQRYATSFNTCGIFSHRKSPIHR